MNPEYTFHKPPEKLTEYFEGSQLATLFRRRAVLVYGNGRWELICCTVEGILPSNSPPEPIPSRTYYDVILHEDLLSNEQCLQFVRELHERHVQLGDIQLECGPSLQWTAELVPTNNNYMESAGHVVAFRFGQQGGRTPSKALLNANQPYYPDVEDAARDWLPFRGYHGHDDARNEQIVFLLPEARAFIASAALSEKGELHVEVDGIEISTLTLLIKGAYWVEKSIHQIEVAVNESKATLAIPNDVDRFEFFLMDLAGTVYDYHREDRFSNMASYGNKLGSIKRSRADQVRQATFEGEGTRIEFKPFVDPEQKQSSNGQKTKLLEIITTVAAFANTDGGHIYLGIDDDCVITGIDQKLNMWANTAIDDSVIQRYLGALKSKIKDIVHGQVTLHLSHTKIDGVLIAVIEVPPATIKPVTIRQDCYLYARVGASNRKVPPDQWKSFLDSQSPFYR